MTRLLPALGMVVALLLPGADPAAGRALSWDAALGGGVTDVETGRALSGVPERDGADGATTVLPYRPGARYRVPVMVLRAGGGARVRLVSVRAIVGTGGYVAADGAVVSARCCDLAGARPFAPMDLDRATDLVLVGLDLRVLPGAPPGWVERVYGVEVVYRRDGVLRVDRQPFSDVQQVVLAGA